MQAMTAKKCFLYLISALALGGCKLSGSVSQAPSSGGSDSLAPCTIETVTTGPCAIDKAGVAVTENMGANVSGTDGALSWTIPLGFYDGTKSATALDSDLLANNIRSGVSVFGVIGDLTPAHAACADNALNSSQCSTAANRYVATSMGSNVTVSGATSAAIPQGFYSGAQTCSVSDTNLTAANIKDGV